MLSAVAPKVLNSPHCGHQHARISSPSLDSINSPLHPPCLKRSPKCVVPSVVPEGVDELVLVHLGATLYPDIPGPLLQLILG